MRQPKFLLSLVLLFLFMTSLIGQATFTKKGNKILIPYMAGFEVEMVGNKAKQDVLAGKDFAQLKPETKGTSHTLNVPANFSLDKAFFDALGKRNSKNTTALPLDLTPILDTFLLKYDPTVNGFPKRSKLILTSLEFQPDLKKAYGHLILVVEKTPGSSNYMLLANSKVEFAPNAVGFKNLRLFLTKGEESNFKTFPFTYLKSVEQDTATGSFAYITCDGFQKFNIQASYTFDPAKMAPKWTHAEITGSQAKGKKTKKGMDTLNRSLKARFIIGGKEIRYFQDARVIELKEGMVFNEENFVLDFEESYVHTKPKLIQNSAESATIAFTGIEFRKLGFSLVGFRKGKGTARKMMRVPAKDFGYTHSGGLTGYVKKVNFLAKNQETLSGWNYSIDTLEFKFKGNTTDTDLTLIGDILLPICQDTFFRYRGSVSFGDGKAKYNFVPIAEFYATRGSQGTKFPIEFLRATMELATPGQTNNNSTIGLNWFGDGNDWYAGEFEPSAEISGVLDFNWTVEEWKKKNWSGIKTKFKFPRLGFQNLKINDSGVGSTNDCAAADAGGLRNMSIEAFKFGGFSGAAVGSGNDDLRPDIADFPIQVSDINFRCLKDGTDVYYKFDLEVKVNVLGKDDDDSNKKETEVKNDKKGDLDSAGGGAGAAAGAVVARKKPGGAAGKVSRKTIPPKTKKVSNWSKFSAAMNKGAFKKTSAAELSGIAQFAIWAKVEDKNGKGFKGLSFDSKRWPVEALYVEGAVSNVAMKGGFVAFNGLEHQRYGNGFKGFLNVEVELGKGGAKIGGALIAQYGTTKAIKITDPNTGGVQWQEGKKAYRYGFVDGEIVYARGVHVAKGLFFHGGGFTIGFNMERSSLSDDIQMEQTQGDQLRNEAVKIADPPPMISQDEGAILEPGVSLTGVKYAPRKDFYSVAIKGVFSWGKLPKASPGGAAAMLAAKGISSVKKPLIAPVVAFDLTIGVDLEKTKTGVGLSKIFLEGNTYVMPEGVTYTDRNDNAGSVKLQLEYNHIAHQFSGQLDVELEFPKDPKGPTTSIVGTALIYFEIPYPGKSGTNKWFVKAGRPPHLGQGIEVGYKLGDLQLGQFVGYVQAGWDLDGIPPIKDVIPEWTNDEVMNPRVVGEDQMRNGNGVAMGAALKVPDKTYDFLMFRAQFYAGLGLDLSLQQYPANRVANLNCGKNGTFGVNNWYARGQAYAYMKGKLDMHVDVLVYEGWVNLFDLYLAAVMRAEMPNPEWFLARIKGRFSALGGLVEGTVNFKAEIGKRCSNLMGNPTANINMIQEVLPEDGGRDVPIYTSPIVTFTMPIEKVLELDVDNPDGTTTKRVFKAELKDFSVNGASGKVTIAKDFRSAVLQFNDLLSPNREYSYKAVVGWKELKGSRWHNFVHAGKQATEEVIGKFKTGDRPDKILAGALEYQAPGYRQRYWHKRYAKAQLVFKNSGWSYLFPKNSNELINYLGSNTGNSQLEAGRQKDYKKKDAIPKDVPFEYIVRLTYKHGRKKEFPLDEFPGKYASVQQPIINYKGGANLSYQLPYVESKNVGGKAVIFDKINDKSFDLKQGKVYKLEIIRRPAAAYLSVARTEVTQKDTSFTDKVLVKSSKSTTGQTKAEQYEFGATINKKLSKIDKSKTGGEAILYKILYEFHFGTSKYNTLADKLNNYNSASSKKGEPKNKYDHPEEKRIPIWKTVQGHRDRYFPIYGGREPLDSYDEIKMLKNLVVTKPFVKKPWKYESDYVKGENNAVVEGTHPWEVDLYVNERRPMGRYRGNHKAKAALNLHKNSWIKWTEYSLDFSNGARKSVPRSIWECSTKKADLRTSLHLDAFSLFSNHIFRPYYEKRTKGGSYETDIQHWAFRIRFNKGARKQLTDNEIKNGSIERYRLNGKIDGLPGTQSYNFAFEDGRERILKSQFELANTLAKIMLAVKTGGGGWFGGFNMNCLFNEGLKSANYYASRYGVDVYDDPVRKSTSRYSSYGNYVEWEFPKIPIWERFDQQVAQTIRESSPYIRYRLGVGLSNTTKSNAEKAENERWVKKIYRNGSSVATTGNLKDASPYTGTGDIVIGGFNHVQVSFKGYLDEVRIWTVARSRSEIRSNYYNRMNPKTKGLVAYLPFEDGNNKGTTKNLVDGSTVKFYDKKKNPIRSRIGRFGGGVYLDGANWGYINNIDLAEKPFTMEAWVKKEGSNRQQAILGQGQKWSGSDNTNKAMMVGFFDGGNYQLGIYGKNTATKSKYTSKYWTHWAVVMEKTKTKTSESIPSSASKNTQSPKKKSEIAVKHDGGYIELHYPEHLNKVDGITIYNNTKNRVEFYWDGQKEESHKWVFDDKGKVQSFEVKYESNPQITYSKTDRDLRQPGSMFKSGSQYQTTFRVDGSMKYNTVKNSEKKSLYSGGRLRTNTHLRLMQNLKTRKTSLKIEGTQSDNIEAMSIYNDKGERVLFVERNYITNYQNGVKVDRVYNYSRNDVVELDPKRNYTLYLKSQKKYKVKYEIKRGGDYWNYSKAIIPVYTMSHSFDDCYLKPPSFVDEAINIALNLRKDDFIELKAGTNQVAHLVNNSNRSRNNRQFSLNNKDFAIEVWLKRTQKGKEETILQLGNKNLALLFGADNKMKFGFGGQYTITPKAYTDTDWHQWRFTYNHTTKLRKIYRDGVLLAEEIVSKPLQVNSYDTFIIGKGFEGEIDEFRVWANDLSTPQQLANTNLKNNKKPTDLWVHLPLNAGKSKLINNSGTANMTGKLTTDLYCHNPWINANYQQKLIAVYDNNPAYKANQKGYSIEYIPPANNTGTTIEFWAKGDGKKRTATESLLFKNGTISIDLFPNDFFGFGLWGGDYFPKDTLFKNDGQWHHYAFVFNVTAQTKSIFVDGKQRHTEKKAFRIHSNQNPLQIGFRSPAKPFGGLIDNFRVWNGVRTRAEIQESTFRKVTACADLLPVNLDFSTAEVKNKNLQQLSDLVINNTTRDLGCNTISTCSTGDCAIVLDGKNNKIIAKEDLDLGKESFTIEIKAKRNNPNNREEALVAIGDLLTIGYKKSGQLGFKVHGQEVLSTTVSNHNKWTHWSCVYSKKSTSLVIYQDGKAVKTTKINAYNIKAVKGKLEIGANKGNQKFEGQIDDIRVWKEVRNPGEIEFFLDKVPSESCPLAAYFNFDEGKGTNLVSKVNKLNLAYTGKGFKTYSWVKAIASECEINQNWALRKLPNSKHWRKHIVEGEMPFGGGYAKTYGIRFMGGYGYTNKKYSLDFYAKIDKGDKGDKGDKNLLEFGGNTQYLSIKAKKSFYPYSGFKAKVSKGKLKIDITKLEFGWPRSNAKAHWPYGGSIEIPNIDDGQWHHYGVIDAGEKIDIYLDAKKVGSIRSDGDAIFVLPTKNFKIGDKGIAIDDLHIWPGTKQIGDMGQYVTSTAPLHYDFNEGPPSTFTINKANKGKFDLSYLDTEWVLRSSALPKTVSTLDGSRPGNTALKFEEANNELIVPGEIDLANKSFTIEFWAKRQEVNRNDFIIGQGKGAPYEGLHIGFRANNQFSFDFYGDGANAPALLETEWHHWAVTYDTKTKKQIIYRDGSKVAENIAKSHYRGKGSLQVSKLFLGWHFKGVLDELRIWSDVRTPNEIKEHYYKLMDAAAPNLIRYFRFNDGKGSKQVGDMTGIGDLTLKNLDINSDWVAGAPFTPIKAGPVKPKDNKVTANSNNALDFDGVDDELTSAGQVDLSNKSFTIEFWAKAHSLNKQNMILGQGQKSTGKGLQIGFRADNKFTCNFHGVGLDSSSVKWNRLVPLGNGL